MIWDVLGLIGTALVLVGWGFLCFSAAWALASWFLED